MQQDISNNPTEIFKQVLVSSARLNTEQLNSLETLIFSYPQCGLLRALHARTGDARKLNEAAAWFSDSIVLQKIVKAPGSLPALDPAHIIIRKAVIKVQNQATQEGRAVLEEPEIETYYEILDEEEITPVKAKPTVADNPDEKFFRPLFREETFDETQHLIIENIAANDYFIFDKAFADRNQAEPEDAKAHEPEPYRAPVMAKPTPPQAAVEPVPEVGGVTRYHDDKMPYSFMWWLDKTRNKHSRVYQPFAKPVSQPGSNVPQPPPETHISELVEERNTEKIVERFMQDEPQIKPQSSSQLDNENKGKQSEQDQEELITETLARIYADQMLYSKSIAAYKILMLKNPEKRRYFASQIENLQKKIN
ncbi:hypothetical protein ACFQ3S_16980 [Mucilaginibacter terrae]|uniref:hypothetical protein n=1 Tax=Mucilaginibacter terrae TaxID=1955052 RepID=UPI0036424566